MSAKLRIALSGPSGVGKSTLAKFISEKYEIPFITTSTKPLWDKHGLTSHLDLIQKTLLNPQWGIDFQHEVLDYRMALLQDKEAFVVDRSPIDNLAYFLLQVVQAMGEKPTEEYIDGCVKAMGMFNGIIMMPFTFDNPLEDDGMRINNRYYQFTCNGAFMASSQLIAERIRSKFLAETIHVWNWEERTAQTMDYIANKLTPFALDDEEIKKHNSSSQ